MPSELLAAVGLESGYNRIQILWGAGVTVHEGETVLLLGANGAGKTTLLKVLMGLLPAWRGSIRFAGEDITHLSTDRRVHRGIALYVRGGCFSRTHG